MNPQSLDAFGSAPAWALRTGQAGRGLVIAGAIAFALAVLVAGFSPSTSKRQHFATYLFLVGGGCLFGAFACLASLFARDQFEFQYVFSHSDILTPLKYKVAGVWSGQQGSFLLWACTSALFGIAAVWKTGIYRRWFIVPYAAFLGSLCGILAYETPFELIKGVEHAGRILLPPTGNGLAPSLLNYWVIIHPPTIFLGFGSLTVLFCWAMSAMLEKNFKDWIHMVRPWALASVSVLGLGVCMGGLWAYETLGWGGFWAWDPVENTSFVPWLFAVAFAHGLIVQSARGRWTASNLLLGGLPFISFVYGTFLTRSGFLQDASVHSFAEMNRSALWILLGLVIASVAAFTLLWLFRIGPAKSSEARQAEPGVHREGLYRLGVVLLSLLGLAIAIGMSVPFFMAVANKPSKVVQEGLYHMVVVWFFVPIMLLVGLVPFASWRAMTGKALFNRVVNVLSVSVGLTGLLVMVFKLRNVGVHPDPTATINLPFSRQNPFLPHDMPMMPWMAVLTFLCVFALVGNFWRIGELSKRSKVFSLGGFVAHIGLAVLMAGLIFTRGFERKEQVIAQPGVTVPALDYQLTPGLFKGESTEDRNGQLPVEITGPSGLRLTAMPGLYWIPREDGKQQTQRWPSIKHYLSHDLYLALGDPVMTMWPDAVHLEPGQSEANSLVKLTYEKMERQGEPGMAGTKFLAKMKLESNGKTYTVSPSLSIGSSGLTPELVPAGSQFLVTVLGMDAATKAVDAQIYFQRPFYPMELFYKPLAILVWVGTGILTLGGLMSVVHRRSRRGSGPAVLESGQEPESP